MQGRIRGSRKLFGQTTAFLSQFTQLFGHVGAVSNSCFASAEAHLSMFVHPRSVPHDARSGAPTFKCTMIRISRSQPHLRQSDLAVFTVFVWAGWSSLHFEPSAGQNRRIFKASLPSTIPRPSHMLCSFDLLVGAGKLALIVGTVQTGPKHVDEEHGGNASSHTSRTHSR